MIVFNGLVAARFTPEVAVTTEMIEAYSKICEVDESKWVDSLIAAAKEKSVEPYNNKRHFMLFFDHYGCLETIADSVEVLLEK